MAKAKHNIVHMIAATVFGLVTIVHALRLSYGWPLVLGTWEAPMWLSWLAVFITGSLSVWLWQSMKK